MPKHDNKIKGKSGEKLACSYLKKKGYEIFHKNFTTEIGELDIVVSDGYTLVFVEVKMRMSDAYGTPAEAVDYHKQRKISEVAAQYIKKFRYFDVPVRFDVVEIYADENRINHIENAFDSYLRY